MHRFFLPKDWIEQDNVTITGEPLRQIGYVLRLKPLDRIIVLDNSGWEFEVAIERITKQQAKGKVINRQPGQGEPAADHDDAQREDQHGAGLHHAGREAAAQCGARSAEAQQQGDGSEGEEKHGAGAEQGAARSERVDLHRLQGTAGHQAVEQADDHV